MWVWIYSKNWSHNWQGKLVERLKWLRSYGHCWFVCDENNKWQSSFSVELHSNTEKFKTTFLLINQITDVIWVWGKLKIPLLRGESVLSCFFKWQLAFLYWRQINMVSMQGDIKDNSIFSCHMKGHVLMLLSSYYPLKRNTFMKHGLKWSVRYGKWTFSLKL